MAVIGEPEQRGASSAEPLHWTTACRLLGLSGEQIATGEALIEDGGGHLSATAQHLQPVGAVTRAIFGRGERQFLLELPARGRIAVELTSSRYLKDGRRLCFFRALTGATALS